MTDYVLTGLVKRRAAMAGEIEATHTKLKALLEGLAAVDATIQQFDPGLPAGGHPAQSVQAPKGLGAARPDGTALAVDPPSSHGTHDDPRPCR